MYQLKLTRGTDLCNLREQECLAVWTCRHKSCPECRTDCPRKPVALYYEAIVQNGEDPSGIVGLYTTSTEQQSQHNSSSSSDNVIVIDGDASSTSSSASASADAAAASAAVAALRRELAATEAACSHRVHAAAAAAAAASDEKRVLRLQLIDAGNAYSELQQQHSAAVDCRDKAVIERIKKVSTIAISYSQSAQLLDML
jgi:hypothetical protein